MNIPPNIKPVDVVLEMSNFGLREDLYSLLVCPVCSFGYNHIGEPRVVSGNDAYSAWLGRGDLLVIPFKAECGSEWEICFGFHKGQTSAFVRIRKSCSEASYLYFIEAVDTGYIKIGRSVNPERRLAQLSTGSPNQLVLLGQISGGSELEAELHRSFGNLRERGEWFRTSGELKQFIKEATA
jgi:hypothetical protein